MYTKDTGLDNHKCLMNSLFLASYCLHDLINIIQMSVTVSTRVTLYIDSTDFRKCLYDFSEVSVMCFHFQTGRINKGLKFHRTVTEFNGENILTKNVF